MSARIKAEESGGLPEIPVIDIGEGGPVELLRRAHDLGHFRGSNSFAQLTNNSVFQKLQDMSEFQQLADVASD